MKTPLVRFGLIETLLLMSLFTGSLSSAAPAALTYQGRIVKTDGTYLENSSVSFIFQILDPSGSCLVYQEQFSGYNMANSGGVFDVPIGSGTVQYPLTGSFTILDSFNNSKSFSCGTCSSVAGIYTCTSGSGIFNASMGDTRKLRVQFHDGIGWKMISPDSTIRSVPFAGYALSAQRLGDKDASDFLLKTGLPTCAPTEFLSWNGSNLVCNAASGALGGTVTSVSSMNSYLSVTNGNLAPALTVNVGTTANTVAAGNDTRIVNAMQSGTTAGGDLSGTYPNPKVVAIQNIAINSTTPTSGDFFKFDGSKWSASTINSSDITGLVTTLSSYQTTSAFNSAVASASCTTSQTMYWNSVSSSFQCQAINVGLAGDVTGSIGAAKVVALQNSPVDTTAPLSNQVLQWNGSKWTPTNLPAGNAGTITGVTAGTGLNGGGTSGAVTLNLATSGVTANSYTRPTITVDATGRITAASNGAAINLSSDVTATLPIANGGTGTTTKAAAFNALSPLAAKGSLITSDGTNNITFPAGTNGYVLSADSTQAGGLKWVAASSGTVASITAGTGLTGGIITSTGTIGLGTELSGVNSLSTTGFVKRTAAGTYSTPAIDLTTDITGTLPVSKGGTGTTSIAANSLVTTNGTGSALTAFSCSLGQTITFDASGVAGCTSTISSAGQMLATSGAASTSPTTGALVVTGGAGISGSLNVGGLFGLGSASYSWSKAVSLSNTDISAGKKVLMTFPSGPQNTEVYISTVRTITDYGVGTQVKFNLVVTNGGQTAFVTSPESIDNLSTFNWYFDSSTGTPYLRFSQLTNSYVYNLRTSSSLNALPTAVVDSGTAPAFATINPTYSLSTALNGDFNISTAGTKRMIVDANGRVGIGTSTPNQKLEVSGTSVTIGTQTNISAFATNGIRISGTGSSTQDAITYQSGLGGGGAAIAFKRGTNWDTGIDFYTNGYSVSGAGSISNLAMSMDPSGNIGINTASPAAKLDVNGQIRITGGTPGVGKVLTSDSAGLATWTTPATNGTVTSITAGTGLTGGAITASGTIGLGTELAAINGLSTTGFVKRTGAGAYSTTAAIDLTSDITGTLPIAKGGTGGITATAALNNLLPPQGSNSGKILQTDGTNTSWVTAATGTVTGVTTSSPLSASGTTTPNISIASGTASGQILRWNGSTWNSTKLNYTDLVNNVSASPWPTSSCNAGEAITWSSASDSFACTTIVMSTASFGSQTQKTFFAAPISSNGNPTFRTIASTDLPTTISVTQLNIGANYFLNTGAGTGGNNIALSNYQSLTSNTTGTDNLALNYQALGANTTGSGNVALGTRAARDTTTGNFNTAVGMHSFLSSQGSYNTAIGFNTMGSITGDQNIAIGYNAQLPSLTGSNQLNIGNKIYGLSNGNIGIGMISPTLNLSFDGNSNKTFGTERQTTGSPGKNLTVQVGGVVPGGTDYPGGDLVLKSGIATGNGNSSISFFTAKSSTSGTTDNVPTQKMTITGSGSVGIGTTSPQATLDVNGSISSQGPAGDALATTFSAASGGPTTITGFTVNSSVGGGFTPSTGVFQPTVAGRYLFTINAYSGASADWITQIAKNGTSSMNAGCVAISGAGYYANSSIVISLNGTTDSVTFRIATYAGPTVTLSATSITWTKLP